MALQNVARAKEVAKNYMSMKDRLICSLETATAENAQSIFSRVTTALFRPWSSYINPWQGETGILDSQLRITPEEEWECLQRMEEDGTVTGVGVTQVAGHSSESYDTQGKAESEETKYGGTAQCPVGQNIKSDGTG